MVSSSSPSPPRKTRARWPRSRNTPAITGASARSATPIAEASTSAGLEIGPRKLKAVATPSALRAPAAKRMEGWKVWAKQKVIPTSRAQDSTMDTGMSSCTPRASRQSAEPDLDDEARLPCLTTRAPAPAATSADMVEMFTERRRSPPVPTMSTAGPGTSSGRAWETIASASPLSSSTLSPLARSATRNPARAMSWTSPRMTASMADHACSALRSRPWIREVMSSGQSSGADGYVGISLFEVTVRLYPGPQPAQPAPRQGPAQLIHSRKGTESHGSHRGVSVGSQDRLAT